MKRIILNYNLNLKKKKIKNNYKNKLLKKI